MGPMLLIFWIFAISLELDPEISEPCLYNQDWYMSEEFIRRRIDNKWFLIKRNVLEDTRAVMPMEIISTGVKFPSAILCVYLFFTYYVAYGEMLWFHDFCLVRRCRS